MILLSRNTNPKLKRRLTPVIIGIILMGLVLVYYVANTSVNTNEKQSKIKDIYLVARHDSHKGFIFTVKETDDKSLYTYEPISEIDVKKDQPVSIHLANGDKDEKHDFNIDEFNVHIRDLWYFEGDTATFVANKTGTFSYYCSLHPKMKGSFTVE